MELKPLTKTIESQARRIIESGLFGHIGRYDAHFNPDITHLFNSYGSNLLTAWIDNKIVGTGALVIETNNQCKIVRMSVLENYRRQGIAKFILAGLEEKARQEGKRSIVLETTTDWKEVIYFYLDNGYDITHTKNGDTWFRKNITDNS